MLIVWIKNIKNFISMDFLLDLSEAIDVYNAWIDACEEANK